MLKESLYDRSCLLFYCCIWEHSRPGARGWHYCSRWAAGRFLTGGLGGVMRRGSTGAEARQPFLADCVPVLRGHRGGVAAVQRLQQQGF